MDAAIIILCQSRSPPRSPPSFRELARAHHPDLNPDADLDAFAEIVDAYELLRRNRDGEYTF